MSDPTNNSMSTTPGPVKTADAVIVGAGFAGLYMLYRLRALGLNVQVYEAGSDVGGVAVRCVSSDALLADLEVTGIPLSPIFAPDTFAYSAKMSAFDVFTTSLPTANIVARPHHAGASVIVASVPYVPGNPSAPVALKSGLTLKGKGTQVIPPGERLIIMTPGGAGIGAPGGRDRAQVASDVADGLVSQDKARDVYAYVPPLAAE